MLLDAIIEFCVRDYLFIIVATFDSVWRTHSETGPRLSGVGTESKETQEREEKVGARSAIARRK